MRSNIAIYLEELSHLNIYLRLICPSFKGRSLSNNAYEAIAATITKISNFFWTHLFEPELGSFWQVCCHIIFTGSDKDESFLYIKLNKFIKFLKSLTCYVCIKHSWEYYCAVRFVYYHNVETAVVVIVVWFYVHWSVVYWYLCKVTGFIPSRFNMNNQQQLIQLRLNIDWIGIILIIILQHWFDILLHDIQTCIWCDQFSHHFLVIYSFKYLCLKKFLFFLFYRICSQIFYYWGNLLFNFRYMWPL